MSDKTSVPEKDGYIRIEKKSALPLWAAAAVWVIFGLFLPMYMWYHYLICAAVSAVAGFAVSRFVPPVVTYEKAPVNTGNPELDDILIKIDEVRESLANAEKVGGERSAEIRQISDTLDKIGDSLRRDPSAIEDARRLFSYYMPVIQKLSEKYVYFKDNSGSTDSTPGRTAVEIEEAFALIAEAMKKFHDSLFEGDALDISTDIDVLEAMLQRDGLN